MNATTHHLSISVARSAGAVALSLVVAACTAAGATNAPGTSSSPGAEGSPAPSANGFYLRASQSQALAPQYTFGWLPLATIADGKFYDGMIAVPAIYPGPMYVGLSFQTISPKGIDEIVAEARSDGLLGPAVDLGGQSLAGAMMCSLELIVDGATHDLSGPCPSGPTQSAEAAGSTAAFADFWSKLTNLSSWIGPELGPTTPYTPSRLAVLVVPPVADQNGPISPEQKPWPLATPFVSFGSPVSAASYRCAVVSGSDLAALLPAVQAGNQLTRFVDGQGMERSLQVRVLLPGETDPC